MMQERLSSPTNTFSKLPAEKKAKIEAALLKEFADKGYQKASLNTVVGSLGIAKGSLYQYFANKESIFLYIFDLFTAKVKGMLQRSSGHELPQADLWQAVRRTMFAGIAFIDRYPDFYQLYLNVLFEHEVPQREELISRVRLFPMEYFGPLVALGQAQGRISRAVPLSMVVFLIDASLDRFLQGYARSYLDGGLGLATMGPSELVAEVDLLIKTLKNGLGSHEDQG
ncbi:MAG: TetR/AcrR family transcriptional regulator [Desulfobulbaceae bacterium]|nr:TetR/AcrR family transcriptional regulator [Desulfobulbaceae bacterium]